MLVRRSETTVFFNVVCLIGDIAFILLQQKGTGPFHKDVTQIE